MIVNLHKDVRIAVVLLKRKYFWTLHDKIVLLLKLFVAPS